MAVKGANRYQILESFEMRLGNDSETEFVTALNEINKIALFRLRDM
ncbi:2-oxo-4-hydroxy-4-carboxy-5-ureidoimidazoline (OHCU) decarboxylase [Vibrio maritimus]|uniref:2-oxo-4-hydroxy-4-carboxy-5-ureidoimidazoline (OHCU) decarboxylase n=2 Tax=Vibrio TaxID=662 RepID=A0A090RXQ4_9VIBR|nr:2-oxo-4-hydroxy-4-carboxy-5-ureidoimidazoline (OHCU) decarboxylase [Vibrio maritimus]